MYHNRLIIKSKVFSNHVYIIRYIPILSVTCLNYPSNESKALSWTDAYVIYMIKSIQQTAYVQQLHIQYIQYMYQIILHRKNNMLWETVEFVSDISI